VVAVPKRVAEAVLLKDEDVIEHCRRENIQQPKSNIQQPMNKLSKQECLPDFTETLPAVGARLLQVPRSPISHLPLSVFRPLNGGPPQGPSNSHLPTAICHSAFAACVFIRPGSALGR
jgi:hypothetical protein